VELDEISKLPLTRLGDESIVSPTIDSPPAPFVRSRYADKVEEEKRMDKLILQVIGFYKGDDKRTLRNKVLHELGGECAHCENSDFRVLQIDHINGGGNRERKRIGGYYLYRKILKDPNRKSKYQVLCANCNWLKRLESKESIISTGN
jgi:hypothetical protein